MAEMKAGCAKVVITPEQPGRIGVMGKPLEAGVEHDIYARALTLFDGKNRLVIVTYDLNCLDVATPILRKRLRDELKLDPAYFVPMGTHNHAAPIQIVPGNFDYGRELANKIFNLIQEAIANESGPVEVKFGSGYGYYLTVMGKAPIDYEVQVLLVNAVDGPMAVLFNQPTHPLQASDTRIDVGHPGYAVDEVEKRTGCRQAMYADAAGGNQFPGGGNIASPMKGSPEEVRAMGTRVADVVCGVLGGPMQDVTGEIKSRLDYISLPLAEPMPYKEIKKLMEKENVPKDIGFVPYPRENRETNWMRALIKHYEENIPFPKMTSDMVCTDDAFLVRKLDEPRDFPCKYEESITATIGPLVFVAMQGEVCAPIGSRIKDAFRRKMPIMVSAYMGEHNLYIPTRDIVRIKTYQARVLQSQYASPVSWSPDVEDVMVDSVCIAIRKMVGE
jgi:hypothetical protein